ncbi:hypothetical protein ACVWZ6_003302 [Bradyrhizobium sp. GM6.1]
MVLIRAERSSGYKSSEPARFGCIANFAPNSRLNHSTRSADYHSSTSCHQNNGRQCEQSRGCPIDIHGALDAVSVPSYRVFYNLEFDVPDKGLPRRHPVEWGKGDRVVAPSYYPDMTSWSALLGLLIPSKGLRTCFARARTLVPVSTFGTERREVRILHVAATYPLSRASLRPVSRDCVSAWNKVEHRLTPSRRMGQQPGPAFPFQCAGSAVIGTVPAGHMKANEQFRNSQADHGASIGSCSLVRGCQADQASKITVREHAMCLSVVVAGQRLDAGPETTARGPQMPLRPLG